MGPALLRQAVRHKANGESRDSLVAELRAELARKIAEQLAKRFGHNSYVLGWQIDNEYSDISFDPRPNSSNG